MLFYFNSIKVRLERYIDTVLQEVVLKFQFHKGAIRTSQEIVTEVFP